ncbi:hypothetical protein ACFWXK_20670 [Streptomyces sp. NPDC059070]
MRTGWSFWRLASTGEHLHTLRRQTRITLAPPTAPAPAALPMAGPAW